MLKMSAAVPFDAMERQRSTPFSNKRNALVMKLLRFTSRSRSPLAMRIAALIHSKPALSRQSAQCLAHAFATVVIVLFPQQRTLHVYGESLQARLVTPLSAASTLPWWWYAQSQ